MYYKAITVPDIENLCYRLAVLWDDNNPDAVICETTFGKMPSGDQFNPDKIQAYVTDGDIDRALDTLGFRVVGRNAPALKWGEAIVFRKNSDHPHFDPVTRDWHAFDRSKY